MGPHWPDLCRRLGRPKLGTEAGEHTDEVLLALGLTWDDLLTLKEDGSIL